MHALSSRITESLLRFYRAGRHLAEWLRYDRRQETDTGRAIELTELGVDHPDRLAYQPTRWSTLKLLLPKSSVQPGDVFVDFGSGMGRMIQAAANYPFARLVGVEVSPDLSGIAKRNFERNRHRFVCQSAEFVTCDAAEYRVPSDMTHAYFFNPFKDETFHRVLQNIIASIDRSPRRVVIFYHQPEMRQMIEESGRFRLVAEMRTARTTTTNVYESIGAREERPAEPYPAQPAVHDPDLRRPVRSLSPRRRLRVMLSNGLQRESGAS